jgi:DNA-binding transcriptional MerR regulator
MLFMETRKEGAMLKIGEFARLSQVSVKTLRHYDMLGLLRPSHIDPESGYRLYEMGQLADMMRILAFKDYGFALDEIADLLQTSDVKATAILLDQRVMIQQQVIVEEQARLQRLIARAKQLVSAEDIALYDVVLKRTEPLTLLGLRQCVATTEDIGPFAQTVWRYFEQQELLPIGPLIHLYFDTSELDEGLDLFVGAPVAALPSALTDLCCERLTEGEQMVCVLYRGDYPAINSAYVALNNWLSTSGYRRSGPGREIYHRSPVHTADRSSYLTEIQYPIRAFDA